MAFNRSVFRSQTVEWPTPKAVYDALNAEFNFDFDPCPLGGADDGLATLFCSWVGKRVFCNPPYGPGMDKWLRRGLEADLAVFLIPARTDTAYWNRYCWKADAIFFLKGRLKFGGHTNSAPFPSAVVVFGKIVKSSFMSASGHWVYPSLVSDRPHRECQDEVWHPEVSDKAIPFASEVQASQGIDPPSQMVTQKTGEQCHIHPAWSQDKA